jgi:hypothetical protein
MFDFLVAVGGIADIQQNAADVRFGPKADIENSVLK